MEDDVLLTTQQAAEALGVTVARVRQLAQAGTLPATRIGRDWVIRRADVAIAAARRTKRGRVPRSATPDPRP
jgi:excisionase family DNA binding protein